MADVPVRLKNLRTQYNMTQSDLAKQLQVSQNAVFNWESGRREPSADIIEKIAEIFNVSPSYLMGWDIDKNKILKTTTAIYGTITDTKNIIKLSALLDELNEKGQEKAIEQTELLTKIPEYQKKKEHPTTSDLVAAHARTDVESTPEGQAHDVAIMNDDSEWE